MIIYSRFNCHQHCLERNQNPLVSKQDVRRARRRMAALRFDDGWLRRRLDLFNTYTVPSVIGQTDQKFRWVGVAHPDSPRWFLDELSAVSKMELKLHEWDVDANELNHGSINLDTDDALARDFVNLARSIAFQGETIFPRGMRYRPHTQCWVTTRTENAHFNLVQGVGITVLNFSHGMHPKKPKQIVDVKQPMWLEVIHEENIANQIRTARKSKNMGPAFAAQFFDLDYGRIESDYRG